MGIFTDHYAACINYIIYDNLDSDLENLDTYEFRPSKRGFKLAALNINSLTAHIEELRVLLADRPIDVLAINETKLDGNVSDNEVNISGYEITRSDRI